MTSKKRLRGRLAYKQTRKSALKQALALLIKIRLYITVFFIYFQKVNATTVKYCRTPRAYSEEFSVVVPPDSISHNTTPNDQLQ